MMTLKDGDRLSLRGPVFLTLTITFQDRSEGQYVVFTPATYDKNCLHPTILFLHGMGEVGTGNNKQVTIGIGPAIKKRWDTFPFITVFPQACESWDLEDPDAPHAIEILDQVQKDFAVDPARVYLTGLSMGGHGTWVLAAKYPQRFAAIAPICGYADPEIAPAVSHLPVWCFHGSADKAVPVDQSRKMIHALKATGASPKYTEYKRVRHNSWDRAYDTDQLYDWFLTHEQT